MIRIFIRLQRGRKIFKIETVFQAGDRESVADENQHNNQVHKNLIVNFNYYYHQ